MANPQSGKDQLQRIAHDAMLQRGLAPDFSAAALRETGAIARAAQESGPAIRDLRALAWASIDNDDSRDLDQLSVSEPLAGAAVKILDAIPGVAPPLNKDSAIDPHAPA